MKRKSTNEEGPPRDGYEGYPELIKENPLFETYYKTIIEESEFESFMSILRLPLPTTFRFTHSSSAPSMISYMDSNFSKMNNIEPIVWYASAYQMKTERKLVRSLPSMESFHKWLCDATENGDICRQEAVSMIPPLLLQVLPKMNILDMCAAPGSKTSQLLEFLYDKSSSDGLLIANDISQQRAFMLYHQVRRVISPHLLITNNDASQFPKLTDMDGNPILFDRILCDVPCSGDGTLRKNVKLWREWSPYQSLGLHNMQLRIVKRAIQLLRPGGLIVYSTCSMHPVENEAIIQNVLEQHKDEIELLDGHQMLPHLKKRSGLAEWKIMIKDGQFVANPQEIVNDNERRRYPSTVFPKAPFNETLKRCIRIVPHDQDTGAFFIAVLRKNENLAIPPFPRPILKPADDSIHYEVFKSKKCKDVVVILKPTHPVLINIFKYYGFDQSLYGFFGFMTRSVPLPPSPSPSTTTTDSSNKIKNIYLISNRARNLVRGDNFSLKIINGGVKAFELYDSSVDNENYECNYRISNEVITILQPFMTSKCIDNVEQDIISSLLNTDDNVMIRDENILIQKNGSLILKSNSIMIPIWKRGEKMKAFVPKANRPALLLQLQK